MWASSLSKTCRRSISTPFLFIECPRQILPYARRVVSDVSRDGGYPPLMLDNVDFSVLYRAKLEELRTQQENVPAN